MHYKDDRVTVHHGDCLDVMRGWRDNSVDSVVTDPPYGLVFMGKAWDNHVDNAQFGAWCQLWATECLRVLKPGGHLLAFGGSRTWHRLACAVEDAGFEVRDSIAWLYGSGFPKSLDVSKAIDKAAGATREVVGSRPLTGTARIIGGQGSATSGRADAMYATHEMRDTLDLTAPATDDARTWQGWGTALKPAFEPIVVGRKPLAGTVAANVTTHGTGALNIDACRVAGLADSPGTTPPSSGERNSMSGDLPRQSYTPSVAGRWPANVVLDQSQADALDRQSAALTSGANPTRRGVDTGGASRFFPTFHYQAKAPTKERPRVDGVAHPTVKPLTLMRWLVRLATPPGGTVLDPFAGSGTTIEACQLEGFRCVAIEREADYLPLIVERIKRNAETLVNL